MGLYSRGLIIRRIFASEIWGTYFREGLFFFFGGGGLLLEFYGMSSEREKRIFNKVFKGLSILEIVAQN